MAFVACSSNAEDSIDEEQSSADALTVSGASVDSSFNGGAMDTSFPIAVGADGSLVGAHPDGDRFVFERFDANGAPLSTFDATTASVPIAQLSRPNGGWWPRNAASVIRCDAGVAPNGVAYATVYARELTPRGQATYSGFVALVSADGKTVGGYAQGLGVPDHQTAGQAPVCLPTALTTDGHLFVQFSIEPESGFGFRGLVPLDSTAHSLAETTRFSDSPTVSEYSDRPVRTTFAGPAASFGNGRVAVGSTTQSGRRIDFRTVQPFALAREHVDVSYVNLSAGASGSLTVLTPDGHVRTFDQQGAAQKNFAIGAPPANAMASAAFEDASGRTWVVFATFFDKTKPSKRTIRRFRADGTRDAAFAETVLEGSALGEDMLIAQVQGSKLIVGSKTASGYHYVRLE